MNKQGPQQPQKKNGDPIKDANEIPSDENQKQTTRGPESPTGPSSEQHDAGLESLCQDLIALPFEAWTMFSRADKSLGDFEKRALGDRLAAIMRKHNMEKYLKDEILFIGILGFTVTRRIRQERVLAMQDIALAKQQQAGKEKEKNGNPEKTTDAGPLS